MKWVEELGPSRISPRAAKLMGWELTLDQVHDYVIRVEQERPLKERFYLRCEALAMMIQRMEEGY